MPRKLLLVGAAVVAAGIFLKRDKVAGLLPSRSQDQPYTPPAPGPSNYDAPGPVANTATPVPAPDPQEPEAIDEAAEEAAAAAEAANIGGPVPEYAGPDGEIATEEYRPLAEAGEGDAEGQEQTEFELEQAAEPTAPGISDAERQIDEAIDEAANPLAGEQVEPVRPVDEPGDAGIETTGWAPPVAHGRAGASETESPGAAESGESATAGETASPESGTPASRGQSSDAGESAYASEAGGAVPAADQPTEEQPAVGQGGQVPKPDDPAPLDDAEKPDEPKDEGGEGTDWRTWSGRSINP